MSTIYTCKRLLRRAAAEKGHVTSEDCQEILKDLDEDLVVRVSNWLFSEESGITVKEAVGPQYQQEVMRKVKSPRVEDIKDTKSRTHKNKNKFQKSKKQKEEASFNLNKKIDEAKEKDTEDEFLPAWKRVEAGSTRKAQWDTPQGFQTEILRQVDEHANMIPQDAYFPELIEYFARVDPNNTNTIIRRFHDAIPMIDDMSLLTDIFNRISRSLSRGYFESYNPEDPKQQQEQTKQQWQHQEQTFDLEEGPDIDLDNKAASIDLPKVIFDKGPEFFVAVALTPAQKAAGLEVVDRLSKEYGMLFPFDERSDVTFHMGRVKFPIDIVFLVEDGHAMKVGSIVHDAIPGSMEHWSHSKTAAVLEVCGGLCNKLGIKEGDVCHFVRE